MFSEEQITKIFSNIEQIYQFHQEILRQLEECFVEDDPYASEIGAVFLNNVRFVSVMLGGGRTGWRKLESKRCEKSTCGGKERPGIEAGNSQRYEVFCESREPLRMGREPGIKCTSSGKFRSPCFHHCPPPPIPAHSSTVSATSNF